MGTRVIYEIGRLPSVVLYSNSSHATEDPEVIFRKKVEDLAGRPTDLVRCLLSQSYQTADGNHRHGDSMFCIALDCEDFEKRLMTMIDGAQDIEIVEIKNY